MAEHDGGTPRWLYWLTVGAVAALEVSAMAALFFS